jgi:hypothetical protein
MRLFAGIASERVIEASRKSKKSAADGRPQEPKYKYVSSVRELARLVHHDHTTVLDHLNAKSPDPATIETYAKGLGINLGDKNIRERLRALRVMFGASCLTQDDVNYYRHLLLSEIALRDEYRDFAEATQRVDEALDGSKSLERNRILHAFAGINFGNPDIVGAAIAAALKRLDLQLVKRPRKAADAHFDDILDALKSLGLEAEARCKILDDVREALRSAPEVVRRNDNYLSGSFWYALAGHDSAERYALAKRLLTKPADDATSGNAQ